MLVRDGSVDTVEGIRRLRLVNANSSEITEHFDLRGRSTEVSQPPGFLPQAGS